MANYKKGYFVIPVSPEDLVVKIKDKFGDIRYSINPMNVSILYVSNNLINVKTGNNLIKLDFANNDEAKIAITELQRQIDIIKGRVTKEVAKKEELINQLDTAGMDFTSIYESGATASGGTASNNVLESRISQLVQTIKKDIYDLKNNASDFVKLNMNPDLDASFSREFAEAPRDILRYEFADESEGMVNVYINGLYLEIGNSISDICHFSADECITCENCIRPGSVFYINTSLLGYELDSSDVITITYLRK